MAVKETCGAKSQRFGVSFAFLFQLLILVSLATGIEKQAKANPIGERFGATFINPGRSDEVFWVMVSNAMQAAADDLNIDLEIHYAERNRIRMRELGLRAAGAQGQQRYLIIVNEEKYGVDIIEAANENNAKTITLLNDLTAEQKAAFGHARRDHPNWLGSVTPDNHLAGREMATAIIQAASIDRATSEPVRVFAIGGDRTTPASVERLAGLNAAIGSDSAIDRIVYANWKAEESYRLANRYLDWGKPRNQVARAFWAANDPIAIGAIRALREHGYRPGNDVFVAGLNWSSDAVDMVERGEMELTHGGHFLGGAWVMVLLRDYHDGHDFLVDGNPNVRFPMMAIDRDNVRSFKAALGDRQWSKIDFRAFTKGAAVQQQGYEFSLPAILRQFD